MGGKISFAGFGINLNADFKGGESPKEILLGAMNKALTILVALTTLVCHPGQLGQFGLAQLI